MKHVTWKTILTLFLIPTLLTGCWDMKEVDLMYYAHALGIDYKDGQYEVYLQILDFSALGKQEGGGAPQTAAWVGKASGETIADAIHKLYATSERRIFWGHMNTLIFTEDLLKEDFQKVVDTFTRFNEFRYTIWMFATREPLDKILLSAPVLDLSPVYSKISDPKDTYEQSSFIQPLRLHRFTSMLREPGQSIQLASLGLTQNWTAKEEKSAINFNGVFLIDLQHKYQSWLPKAKVLGLRWMNPETIRTPLTITVENQPAATFIFRNPKVKVIPSFTQGKPTFQIKVAVTGNVPDKLEEISEADLKKGAETLIQTEIKTTFEEGVKQNTDIYNLLDEIYRKHPYEWKRLVESDLLQLTSNSLESVEVTIKITHEGRSLNYYNLHR